MSNTDYEPFCIAVDLAAPNNADFSATTILLPRETMETFALALLAGAHAIDSNTRIHGASYAIDFAGRNGGPYMVSYYKASGLLEQIGLKIWEQVKEE